MTNIEAEQCTLGSMIMDREAVTIARSIVQDSDFYNPRHAVIFNAILELKDELKPIDFVTLETKLKQLGQLENVGGLEYLGDIATIVPTSAHIKQYATDVRESALLRWSHKHFKKQVQSIEEGTKIETVTDNARQFYLKLSKKQGANELPPDASTMELDWLNDLETNCKNYKNGKKIVGISTGFPLLDVHMSGLVKGETIVLSARPSVGKTALALHIAQNIAFNNYFERQGQVNNSIKKKNTLIFSLEMPAKQLINRIASNYCEINSMKLRNGNLNNDDWNKLSKFMPIFSDCGLTIDDRPHNIAEICSISDRLKASRGLDLIMIDYLQLIEGVRRGQTTEERISDNCRALKLLARELEVPIVELSQLNRESTNNATPTLGNLRGSGAIEQDADVVIMLYRDPDNANVVKALVGKSRSGFTGEISYNFYGAYNKFVEIMPSGIKQQAKQQIEQQQEQTIEQPMMEEVKSNSDLYKSQINAKIDKHKIETQYRSDNF